jgi:hypothetical protein
VKDEKSLQLLAVKFNLFIDFNGQSLAKEGKEEGRLKERMIYLLLSTKPYF